MDIDNDCDGLIDSADTSDCGGGGGGGDLVSESWNSADPDEGICGSATCWNLNAAGGGVCDDDESTTPSSGGFVTEWLEVAQVKWNSNNATVTLSSAQTGAVYISFYWWIASGYSGTDSKPIIIAYNSSNAEVFKLIGTPAVKKFGLPLPVVVLGISNHLRLPMIRNILLELKSTARHPLGKCF